MKDIFRVAILGAGNIAAHMAEALSGISDEVCMYAVASRNLEKAEAFQRKWGFEKAYGSYEELAQDKAVDLVYVATPHSEHFKNTRLCLENGRNCLVEKAFCANLHQTKQLLALAKQKKLLLAEAMWTRYLPSKNLISNLLSEGIIGKPHYVEADFSAPIKGVERLVNPALAGGALLDLGIYSLTVPAMYLGTDIEHIHANAVLLETGVDATDEITLTYRNGAVARVKCSFTEPVSNYAKIVGDNGSLVFSPINAPEKVSIYDASGDLIKEVGTPYLVNGYEYEVLECKRMLSEGRLEAASMPLSETVRMMGWMDSIRCHIGVVYPFETREEIAHEDEEIWGVREAFRVTKQPAWLDNAIFYEIYPQSFQDSNGDGIGDFQGIISRLDYILDLGCNAIWMNPCFASPFGDAGYDVSDYYQAAPRYGTNEDLKRLFEEVHKRGMHILLDLVPGHTSWEHPWFIESKKAQRNVYTDRYVWTDSIWEEPEGYGSLRGISDRDGSCAVNFFSHQPALNYGYYRPDAAKKWQQSQDAPGPRATLEAMKEVMRFWLTMGCDGFRVDMAGSLVKCDSQSRGTIRLWQEVRAFLDKEFPEAAMISEWGEPDKSLQGGFHMDFLLHFGPSRYNELFRCQEPFFSKRGKGNIGDFVRKYMENYEKSGKKGLICIPSGNHDMDRLARYLQGEELKIAFAFLLSMPGAPFIYYGDEIGMRYVENLTSVEGGYNRTGSRSPMQWDGTRNAGFSTAEEKDLYIPLDAAPGRPTVEKALADPDSLLHEIQRMIAVRQEHKALQSKGEITFIWAEDHAYPLAYVRSSSEEKILVIINPAEQEAGFSCELLPVRTLYSLGGELCREDGRLTVRPCSAGWYLL